MYSLNIFDNPMRYRKELLSVEWIEEKRQFNGRPLICVFFTFYCVVGCPFCFFRSPEVSHTDNQRWDRESRFSPEAVDKFIRFANDSNVGYLQISGGGEPFLEFDAICRCIKEIKAERIILVTSGYWAKNRQKAEQRLRVLYNALRENPSAPRLTVRLSVSADHSIRLKEGPLVNLLDIFASQYRNAANFTLQIKYFEDDTTLTDYLDKYFSGYQITFLSANGTDDEQIIKIMPWKYRLTLPSGYEVIMGKSRVFNPTLCPNLADIPMTEKNVEIFDLDLSLSQNDYPSLVYNSDGSRGFDWIIEYNGNVCTWQNRVQDNLLNIYEDTYADVVAATQSDLISYSFIDKGAKYRESIVSEVSPRTVKLMKAVNIRDYASTLMFADEKIRLYYNIRVLQDYLAENKIDAGKLEEVSPELSAAITGTTAALKEAYVKASYSVLDQELGKPLNLRAFHDFLYLIKCGHFELSAMQVEQALNVYNSLSPPKRLNHIGEVEIDSEKSTELERRLTKRVMTRKRICHEDRSKKIILCRHGQTNWNIEGRIKGHIDGLETAFTPKGMEQIRSVMWYLAEQNVEAIFTSDLYRAVETMKIINASLNLPVYFYKPFRGLNMGNYQGQLMSDFLKDKQVCRAFSDYDYVIPGGESINQLNSRFVAGLDLLCEEYPYETVSVISHGAAISNVKSHLSKDPFIDIDYCVLSGSCGSYQVLASGTYSDLFANKLY